MRVQTKAELLQEKQERLLRKQSKKLSATKSPSSNTKKKPLKKSTRSISKKAVKPGVAKLKKEADKWFSRYVRYRDGRRINGEWYSQCITSGEWIPFNKVQAGHFMSRRYNNTRFEEENVNAQSFRDNVLFYGEQYKYALAVDAKYGEGTAKKLADMAKLSKKFTVQELEDIINDAKKACAFYESQ